MLNTCFYSSCILNLYIIYIVLQKFKSYYIIKYVHLYFQETFCFLQCLERPSSHSLQTYKMISLSETTSSLSYSRQLISADEKFSNRNLGNQMTTECYISSIQVKFGLYLHNLNPQKVRIKHNCDKDDNHIILNVCLQNFFHHFIESPITKIIIFL